jgi:GcrA cell cycle regulator
MTLWSHSELDRLAVLAADGRTASQIADLLCEEFGTDRSRNAVLGRMMRSGIKSESSLVRGASGTRHASAPKKTLAVSRRVSSRAGRAGAAPPHPVAPAAPYVPPANLPATLPVTFAEAMFSGRCLHFVGDPYSPDGADMPVCGAERAQFAPDRNRYCRRHLESSHDARAA